MICWRPVGVMRSAAAQMPQQSYVTSSLHVGKPSEGGVWPGRPRANQSPTLKHAEYCGAVAS